MEQPTPQPDCEDTGYEAEREANDVGYSSDSSVDQNTRPQLSRTLRHRLLKLKVCIKNVNMVYYNANSFITNLPFTFTETKS